MLLLTLRGTPTLYQGDELGIGRVVIPPGRIRDPQDLRQPGKGLGRDGARTPMPWDGSAFAGFSSAEPWLPLNDDWPVRNVVAQDADPGSMLALYRRLLALRRKHAELSSGGFLLVPAEDEVLQYERRHGVQRLLVALNFGARERQVLLPRGATARLLVSTAGERPYDGVLAPGEGAVLRLEGG